MAEHDSSASQTINMGFLLTLIPAASCQYLSDCTHVVLVLDVYTPILVTHIIFEFVNEHSFS